MPGLGANQLTAIAKSASQSSRNKTVTYQGTVAAAQRSNHIRRAIAPMRTKPHGGT